MSTLKKNIWRIRENNDAPLQKLSSPWTIVIATVLIWFCSIFPPIFEFANQMAFELGAALILIYGGVCFKLLRKKEDRTPEKIYALILFGGVLLRFFYVLVTSYMNSNHDIGAFSDSAEMSASGHLGYIGYIYTNWHLPDFDPRQIWGFYNPPAFYYTCAAVLKLTSLLDVSEPYVYEALQSVPFFFSAMTLWVMGKILQEFPIKEKFRNLLLAVLVCHPYFFVSAATLTNDAMATFFSCLCIWLTIRWYKEQTLGNILPLALSLGLAIATKINAGLVGFGIAFVFIWAFFSNLRDFGKYLPQFGCFLLISVPIAFFYPVRNYLLYQIPPLYVQQLESNNQLLISGINGLDRLFFPSMEALTHPFQGFAPEIENNLWVELIRSSLFDEFYSENGALIGIIAMALFWLGLILALGTFILLVLQVFFSKNLPLWQRGFLGIAYFTALLSFIVFAFSEPYLCSMHYRYIAPTIIYPMVGTGVWLSGSEEKYPTLCKWLGRAFVAFIALSVMVVFWLAVFAMLQDASAVTPMMP